MFIDIAKIKVKAGDGGDGADSDEDEIFIHPAAADFCAFRRAVLPLNGQLPAAVRQIRPG